MSHVRRSQWKSPSRRGIQTLEAIIAVVVLVITFMAVFEFGVVLTVQHAVGHAAVEAARERAKGATDAEVEAIVETILEPHLGVGFDISTDPGVRIIIEGRDRAVPGSGVTSIGDATIGTAPAVSVITSAEEVKVTVRLELDTAPIPNLLDTFCFDVEDRDGDGVTDYYEICSLARFERPLP